ADWHPDILEFIISKMQNPRILRYLIEKSNDDQIKQLAKENLKFTPFTAAETEVYDTIAKHKNSPGQGVFSADIINHVEIKSNDGVTYYDQNLDFLTGPTFSITKDVDVLKVNYDCKDLTIRVTDTKNSTERELANY